jgi:hypothetical protein
MRTTTTVIRIGIASMIWLACPADAYHPMVTDDTGTQGLGGNQLELGYDYDRGAIGWTGGGHSFPITYTRGVSDTLDIFLGRARMSGGTGGWGNVGLGAKWRFYSNDATGLSLGVEPEVQLPVSAVDEAKGLGNGRLSCTLTFLAAQNTTFGQIFANVMVDRDNFADASIADRRTKYRLSVAPVLDVSPYWRVALDVGLKTNPDRSRRYRMGYVDVGTVYSPSAAMDLSVGVIRDIVQGPLWHTKVTSEVTWHF